MSEQYTVLVPAKKPGRKEYPTISFKSPPPKLWSPCDYDANGICRICGAHEATIRQEVQP